LGNNLTLKINKNHNDTISNAIGYVCDAIKNIRPKSEAFKQVIFFFNKNIKIKPILLIERYKDNKTGKPPQDIGTQDEPIVKNAAIIKPKIERTLLLKRHFIVE
jgi:hypothetical protein